MYYIDRKKEKFFHFSKIIPKKSLRQFLTCKTKENNMISLRDLNIYLRMIYESSYVVNMQTLKYPLYLRLNKKIMNSKILNK